MKRLLDNLLIDLIAATAYDLSKATLGDIGG